jgi:hypothetical protein
VLSEKVLLWERKSAKMPLVKHIVRLFFVIVLYEEFWSRMLAG